MSAKNKACQSCGMPLKRDPKGGGSNADHSISGIYCSHCFVNGEFTEPNVNLEQMQAKVKEKLKEFGFPGFLCWVFTRKIPKLSRWNP